MPKLCLQNILQGVRVLKLTPGVKRVLGVALPNSPSKEASRVARFLCEKFPYRDVSHCDS